jgi:2-C-methyl-D-erythritol 4-phosphate cytidylyltransferase
MLRRIALIPAAGLGSRFGAAIPKQYLPLAARPMLYHAVSALARAEEVDGVFVVLSRDDRYFEQYDWSGFAHKLASLYCGGPSRAESVQNGLAAIEEEVNAKSWVLVHDAARPCLMPSLVARLVNELAQDEVGGLLAVPVADTLKRSEDNQRVSRTEARKGLWQAQTPQMFRYGLLAEALRRADRIPTDEAEAVEALGVKPKLVHGDASNIKVTYPEDLKLAELILRSQRINHANRSRV